MGGGEGGAIGIVQPCPGMPRNFRTDKPAKTVAILRGVSFPAVISAGDRVVAQGGYELDWRKEKGLFWPADGRRLDAILPEASLFLTATGAVQSIRDVRQSPDSSYRWEFDVVLN